MAQSKKDVRRKQWILNPWEPSSKSQEDAILAMNAVHDYAEIKCSHEFFDWQYRQNPAGIAAIKLAVDIHDHQKLAGNYVVIPLDFVCGSKTIIGGLSLNTLTDSQYRRQGIFSGLADEIYQMTANWGWPLVIGYPNPSSYPGFIKRLEFRDVAEIPLLIRILHLSEVLKSRFPVDSLRKAVGSISKVGNFYFRPDDVVDSSVEKVERFDEAFGKLNERLIERFPIFIKRDAKYLNWRYIDSPRDYHILGVREKGEVLGYIVYRIMKYARMRCGMILDLITQGNSSSEEVGVRLVRSALSQMMAEQCDISAALCLPSYSEFNILRRTKFIVCPKKVLPQPFPYIVRRNIPNFEFEFDIFDIQNWFVSMGDYDAV